MRLNRRRWLRLLFAAAVLVTTLFAASTLFAFGVSSHREPQLSWHSSSSGYGIVQLVFAHGQFHVTIDFAGPPSGTSRSTSPRGSHAGATWNPNVDINVRLTHRLISRLGFDAFLIRDGTYFSVGIFGAYPVALAWALVWLLARKSRMREGHCHRCGYDLRASRERCPECGEPISAPWPESRASAGH